MPTYERLEEDFAISTRRHAAGGELVRLHALSVAGHGEQAHRVAFSRAIEWGTSCRARARETVARRRHPSASGSR